MTDNFQILELGPLKKIENDGKPYWQYEYTKLLKGEERERALKNINRTYTKEEIIKKYTYIKSGGTSNER